jgi:hypothetical protein
MAVTDIPTPTAITMTRTMVDATWFLIRRRVMTRYGWRIRRVQVSG